MNVDATLEWLHIYMVWVTGWLLTTERVIQYVLVLVSFMIAAYVSRYVRTRVSFADDNSRNQRLKQFSNRVVRRLTFPLTLLILIGIGVLCFQLYGVKHVFLSKSLSLAMAWGFIRFGSAFINNPSASRIATTLIWIVAALSILGYLQITIAWLDSIKFGSDENSLTLYDTITSTLSVAAFVWGALLLSDLIERSLESGSGLSPSAQALFGKISKFALLAIAFLTALNTVGIDLTAFAVFGGAVGVGIGLGLQKVFSNLIAGIILLMDKSIKPGDTIVMDGRYGKVNRLSARYVSMITRDGIELLIPNDHLINNQVENWSYTDENVRLRIPIGVHYKADVNQAIELCLQAAAETPRVIKFPKPACLLKSFGDSTVDLEVRIWVRDPMNGCANVKSQVMLNIWEKFHKEGIEIPYPQRDLHLRSIDSELAEQLFAQRRRTPADPTDD